MNIIAHRGYWKRTEDKNTITSMEKAFQCGYGIETDIRDYCGKLVLSHDIATAQSESVRSLFELYRKNGRNLLLALNVKADGIQNLLFSLLKEYGIWNYFLFDMSVPELIINQEMGLRFFTRQSDVEFECVKYENAEGVWMDSFFEEAFVTEDIVGRHLSNHKKVCIVSPELHGRDSSFLWSDLKRWKYLESDQLYLCTDKPEEASNFFRVGS